MGLVLVALAACIGSEERPRPDWGHLSLAVTSGEQTVRVERAGVVCGSHGSEVSVRSHGSGPYWSLWVEGETDTVRWSTRPSAAEAIQPGPTWVTREPAGLRIRGGTFALAGVVAQRDGSEAVTIDAEIRCPVAADPLPAAALDALRRAAGQEPDAAGARASVRVEAPRVGAVVDRLRGEVGPGLVVWAGAIERGEGRISIARGVGPADIVRYAEVAGERAAEIAERLQGWSETYRIDLVAADEGSITARLPPDADLPALAREVAELCPLVLAAADGRDAVLQEQLRQDRQLVCWWD